eukprot:3898368-Pyramimonas_sp.AAC.1
MSYQYVPVRPVSVTSPSHRERLGGSAPRVPDESPAARCRTRTRTRCSRGPSRAFATWCSRGA